MSQDQTIIEPAQTKRRISFKGFFDPSFDNTQSNISSHVNQDVNHQVISNEGMFPNYDLPEETTDDPLATSPSDNSVVSHPQIQAQTDKLEVDNAAVQENSTVNNFQQLQQENVAEPATIENVKTVVPPDNGKQDGKFIEVSGSNENPNKTDNSSQLDSADIGGLLDKDIFSEGDLAEIVGQGYIPKIVAGIINFALNRKASDIHIEPQSKMLRIRCRIDGVLIDIAKTQLSLHPPIISRIKILSKLKIDETRIPQDGRFGVVFKDKEVDVRVSCLPTVHGEKVVLRILDKSQKILSLEDLGMVGSGFDKTIEAIKKPWGIVLVTGPTGSGKSTTLNAVLSRLNQPGINIVTLEDPVEYESPGINQCQVKPDIGFTFAAGLRSVLRQDPNIIMVGEIRDAETASMTTHAALTGHLVLSTLHTNDTAGSLPRLINMGVEPFLITSAVDLVIAQRLVRVICPKCKEKIKLPPKLVEEIKRELDMIPQNNLSDRARIPREMRFFYGRGCSECTSGFKGRMGIFEVMRMTPKIEDLAVSRRPSNEIFSASKEDGMITLKQDGILKALAGTTTVDEILQATMSN